MAPNPAQLTGALTSAALFLIIITTTTTTHASSSTFASASNLITQTCKQTPDYNLCVSSLTADPRGPKANDVQTLALIMIDVVSNKAAATSDEIKRLVSKGNPALKEPLMECADKYKVVVNVDVGVAIKAVRIGNPGAGEGAMNDAGNKSDSCERGFQGLKSPLADMNHAVRSVADVASAIISLLI